MRFERDSRSIELGLVGAAKGVTPKVSGSTVIDQGLAGGDHGAARCRRTKIAPACQTVLKPVLDAAGRPPASTWRRIAVARHA
ncbi:hypothetical protein [Micromonospora sp. NPDC002717]|uniref:hypothetical protein n=1 Tax=Micromonospora sp. NPDC002717 TaxID=3154424 RepID=UPI003334270A